MKAGSYIRSQHLVCRAHAIALRKEADELENKVRYLRKKAEESDAEADRWAKGTDLEKSK